MSDQYETGTSDLGRQVLAVIWSLSGISGLVLTLRIYCKFARNRGLWWDDWLLILSWVFLIVPSATTTVEVQLGFGHHVFLINPANLFELGLLGQITAFFSILGALFSKTSFAATLLRITKDWTKITVWLVIASMNIFMLLSALFTWIQCTPVTRIWDKSVPGTCWDQNIVPTYNTFSGVYSGVMDICLAMLPWAVIINLQMTKKEKFGVAIAMSMGVFAGITGFVKSAKIHTLASGDFTFDGVPLVIWGAAETATTIIATSIPVLRALFSELRKNSSRRYYNHSNPKSGTVTRPQRSVNKSTIVTVHARSRSQDVSSNDTASDKSILAGGSKIIKTSVVSINYNTNSAVAESPGLEMDEFAYRAPKGRAY